MTPGLTTPLFYIKGCRCDLLKSYGRPVLGLASCVTVPLTPCWGIFWSSGFSWRLPQYKYTKAELAYFLRSDEIRLQRGQSCMQADIKAVMCMSSSRAVVTVSSETSCFMCVERACEMPQCTKLLWFLVPGRHLAIWLVLIQFIFAALVCILILFIFFHQHSLTGACSQ